MSYDPQCLDIAQLFLSDVSHRYGDADTLAQVIQNTIEDFIEYELPRRHGTDEAAAE